MPVDISVASAPASAWLMRFAGLIKPEGRVLEIACGNGRNTRFLKALWVPRHGSGCERARRALSEGRGLPAARP